MTDLYVMQTVQTILAVDFDGTLAEESFPKLGLPRLNAVKYMQLLKEENYYLIIWTCREGEHVEWIKDWCRIYGVPYDQINQHHPALVKAFGNDTRKVAADVYIDDKGLMGVPDCWSDTYQEIKKAEKRIKRKLLTYTL